MTERDENKNQYFLLVLPVGRFRKDYFCVLLSLLNAEIGGRCNLHDEQKIEAASGPFCLCLFATLLPDRWIYCGPLFGRKRNVAIGFSLF